MGVTVSRVGECTCHSSLRLMECVSCDSQLFVGKPSPWVSRVPCEVGGSNKLGDVSEGIRPEPALPERAESPRRELPSTGSAVDVDTARCAASFPE